MVRKPCWHASTVASVPLWHVVTIGMRFSKLRDCLFHAQVTGFQPAYTIVLPRVRFKHFVQEREVAIERCSFNQNPWKLSVKKLIRSKIARFQPINLQKKKRFLKHTASCILPSFSQKALRLLLPGNITFKKYKRKAVLLPFRLFNYDSPKLAFFT